MIDFDTINRIALVSFSSLVERWAPGGYYRGKEYVVKNPTRPDNDAGSFSINTDNGIWSDFATGDSGGDPISLYAYINRIGQGEAARELSQQLNIRESDSRPQSTPRPARKKVESDWKPIFPVPADAPPKPTHFTRKEKDRTAQYEIKSFWAYKDNEGNLLGYATRFEGPRGKETPPLTFCEGPEGRREWRFLSFPAPRPLYNMYRLAQTPKQPVLGVEGEKCADALQQLYNENGIPITVITWPGGCKAVKKANWKLLAGRKFCYWPDADKKTYPHTNELAGQVMPKHEQPGYKAALSIAEIVRDTISEMKIIDPPEDKPDGWDVYDAIHIDRWNITEIQNFIKNRAKLPPPPVPAPNAMADAPFRCLGYDGDYHYYLPSGTKQIKAIKGESHNANALLTLASLWYWARKFPGKKGNTDWHCAASAVLRESEKEGVYDPSRLRGRGAWWDRDRVVVHLGDRLIVNNHQADISKFDSRYIYEARLRIDDDFSRPLINEESQKLVSIVEALHWENPLHAYYLLGWCALAPICGALYWRPHIWLTGQKGTGKSYVVSNIIKPIIGPMGDLYTAPTTAAGLRSILKTDALAVMYDESEAHTHAGQNRLEDVFELMRQASLQSDAKIAKGTSDQKGKTFEIRSMFCLSSIGVNITQAADESRIAVASLIRPRHLSDELRRAHFDGLKRMIIETLTPAYCSRLRARSISLIPIIRKNTEIFTDLVSERFGDRRIGDQYGTLLAGAFSLQSDGVIDISAAREWMEQHNWTEVQENQPSDERNILEIVLQHPVKVNPSCDMCIEELLTKITAPPESTGFAFEAGPSAEQENYISILKRYGIRIDKDETDSTKWILWISDSHRGLKEILEKTPWPRTWGRLLKRLPGSIQKSCVRFAGGSTRATGIPWEGLV